MGWFKLWDEEWLEKNKNKDLAIQGAMVRLMCVANVSFDNGKFTHRGKVGLTTDQIVAMADIDQKMWMKMVETGFIAHQGTIWTITGWSKYQSEYERKKGYIRKTEGKRPIKKDKSVGQPVGTSKGAHLDVKDSKEVKDVKDVTDLKDDTEGKDRYQGKNPPPVDAFLGWFYQEFKDRFNESYLVSKDEDIRDARKLLTTFGLDKTKSLVAIGWDSKNPYHLNKSKTISGLASIANELITAKKESKKNETKYGTGKALSL